MKLIFKNKKIITIIVLVLFSSATLFSIKSINDEIIHHFEMEENHDESDCEVCKFIVLIKNNIKNVLKNFTIYLIFSFLSLQILHKTNYICYITEKNLVKEKIRLND